MILSSTADIALNAFAAMMKIAIMSCVGVFFAKYPKQKPIMSTEFIQTLSKLSNNVFIPCLILTSLGSGVNQELLSRIGILIVFCGIINGLSYTLAYTLGRCLHGTNNATDNLYKAMAVAIGSSKQCYTEGTSMLFVYSIGWHLIFWSYGFPILKSLKEEQLLADTTAESSNSSASASAPIPITLLSVSNPPQLLRDEVDRDSSNSTNNRSSHGSRINSSLSLCELKVLQSLLWLLSVLSSPAMMAIIVGVTISLIPPLQRMLFEDMSIFRPLGSAITTLGEPVVATSCLIMSASLANVDLSRGRPRIHHTESDGIGGVEMTAVDSEIAIVRSPLQSALHAVKEYALLRGNFGLASTHGSIHGGGNNSDQSDHATSGSSNDGIQDEDIVTIIINEQQNEERGTPNAAVIERVEHIRETSVAGSSMAPDTGSSISSSSASNRSRVINQCDEIVAPLPSWRSVGALVLCRLVLPPLLVIYAVLPLALHFRLLRVEDRLMQLVIAIEASSTSAQLIIVSLNQLGLNILAQNMAYIYVFEYFSSVCTITLWVTVAMSKIYIN